MKKHPRKRLTRKNEVERHNIIYENKKNIKYMEALLEFMYKLCVSEEDRERYEKTEKRDLRSLMLQSLVASTYYRDRRRR